MEAETLRRTPLNPVYAGIPGTKLVDFGGWEMPIQFSDGILAEHQAVRKTAGLFDVSHMGEIRIQGNDAGGFLNYLVTNKIDGTTPGRCVYTPMCRSDGGTVDDLLVYIVNNDDFLLVVNAANTEKDFQWITSIAGEFPGLRISDVSGQWAQLALQGPTAVEILQNLSIDFSPNEIPYYSFLSDRRVNGIPVLISRTGYTGEDGFELYCAPDRAAELWSTLLGEGAVPCGLGARDLLRLEARFPLYGHELNDETSPLEAGLGPFVKLDKDDFVGRESLSAQKETGIPRRLYGLEMLEPGVPREGYPVYSGVNRLGNVSSGGKSPVRRSFIALALLQRNCVNIGDDVSIEIRGKMKRARVVKTPFYRREG